MNKRMIFNEQAKTASSRSEKKPFVWLFGVKNRLISTVSAYL